MIVRGYLKKTSVFLMWAVVTVSLWSCKRSEAERYLAREKKELDSGIRKDSLFLGLYFGMEKKEFREYCFEMNLQGNFKQGGLKNNIWVESKIEGMEYSAAINFYPNFTDDKITEMNAAIYYVDPVYRNGMFQRDSLLLDVLRVMDRWYGGEVFKIKSPFYYREDVYVKVVGNKRITIYPDPTGQLVNLWYLDLTKLNKERNVQ